MDSLVENFLWAFTWFDEDKKETMKEERHKIRKEFTHACHECYEFAEEAEEKFEECLELYEKLKLSMYGALSAPAFIGPLQELRVFQYGDVAAQKNLMGAEVEITGGKNKHQFGRIVDYDEGAGKFIIELDFGEGKVMRVSKQRKNFDPEVKRDIFQSVFAEINESKTDNYYSWLSEFFDLIIVAAIVKLAENTKYRMKDHALGDTDARIGIDVLVCYLLFFTVFLEHTMIWVRFTDAEGRLDDYLHKFFGFGLVLMAVFIPTGCEIFYKPEGIIGGWWICMMSLFALHAFYYYIMSGEDIAQDYCLRRMVATALAGLISIPAFFAHSIMGDSPGNFSSIFMFISTLPVIVVELNSVRLAGDVINATTNFLSERFGIFVLILMGESILALIMTNMEGISDNSGDSGGSSHRRMLASSYEDDTSSSSTMDMAMILTFLNISQCNMAFVNENINATFLNATLGIASTGKSYDYGSCTDDNSDGIDLKTQGVQDATLILFFSYAILLAIYILYFNGHPSDQGQHALDNSHIPGSSSWLFLHMPFGFFLIWLGSSFKLLMYYIAKDSYEKKKYKALLDDAHAYIFMSLFLIVITCYLIRFTHKQFAWRIWPSWTLRPLTLLPMFIMYWLDYDYDEVQMTYTATIFIAIVVACDIYCMEFEDREKKRILRLEKAQRLGTDTTINIEKIKKVHTVKATEMQKFARNSEFPTDLPGMKDHNSLAPAMARQRSKAPSFMGLHTVTKNENPDHHGDDHGHGDEEDQHEEKRHPKTPEDVIHSIPAPSPRGKNITTVNSEEREDGIQELDGTSTDADEQDKRFVSTTTTTGTIAE